MPVISIETAKTHLRVDDDTGDDVLLKLESAIDSAEQYLNRKVFESSEALQTERNKVADLIVSAQTGYNQSIASADLISDWEYRNILKDTAKNNKKAAMRNIRMIESGIVINPSIEIGILMILGHLYANREDVVVGLGAAEIPKSSKAFLDPYRVDLGV